MVNILGLGFWSISLIPEFISPVDVEALVLRCRDLTITSDIRAGEFEFDDDIAAESQSVQLVDEVRLLGSLSSFEATVMSKGA